MRRPPHLFCGPALGRLVLWFAGWAIPAATFADAPDANEREARAILNRWAQASGGAERIARLKTMDSVAELSYGPGVPPTELHSRARMDGAYRIDFQTAAFGRITQAFDGRFAWQRNDVLGFGHVSAEVHNANLVSVDFMAPLHVALQFPGRKKLPDATIDGRQLQVVELTDRAGGIVKWYFDPATGLRVRLEASDRSGTLLVEYSDFHTTSGITEPFSIKRRFNGKPFDITVRSVLYNEDIDPELFAAPLGPVEDDQQVERILRDYATASGLYQLQKIQTRVTKSRIEILSSGIKMTSVMSQKQPNLLLIEQDTPGMGMSLQGYDGRVGWAWSELQGYRTMQGAELQQLQATTDLTGAFRLSALCPFRKILEEKEDHGRRILGIALGTFQGPAGIFYFDTRTNDLVRVETFVQMGPDGQMKVVADFADFRRVDGILIPFKTTITNPAMQLVTTIESVEHDVPLDDAIFRPKKD